MYPYIINEIKNEPGIGRVVEKKFVEKSKQIASADKSSDDAPSYGPGWFINQEVSQQSNNNETDNKNALDKIEQSFHLKGLANVSTTYDKTAHIHEEYHGEPFFEKKG